MSYLFEYVIKEIGLQVLGDIMAQVTVKDSKQTQFMAVHFLELRHNIVLHRMVRFAFHKVKTVCDVLPRLAFTSACIGSAESSFQLFTPKQDQEIEEILVYIDSTLTKSHKSKFCSFFIKNNIIYFYNQKSK